VVFSLNFFLTGQGIYVIKFLFYTEAKMSLLFLQLAQVHFNQIELYLINFFLLKVFSPIGKQPYVGQAL
jgi:hypothetical protein